MSKEDNEWNIKERGSKMNKTILKSVKQVCRTWNERKIKWKVRKCNKITEIPKLSL